MSNYHQRTRSSWQVEADQADYADFLADKAADAKVEAPVPSVPAWVPERAEGESDESYWGRYASAEFQAMLDGQLANGPSTYEDRFGEVQWADPTGRRSWR